MFKSAAFCVAFLASVFGSDAQLNMTELCPYNTFCTSGPLKAWTPDENQRPCCELCLCTEDCGLFGKCCYDFEPKVDIEQIHRCYTQYQLYNIPRSLSMPDAREGFITITSCPEDDQGYESCLEMQKFDDYITVSRNTDGRIYVNRKCALCNGVEDVVEWTLNILDCEHIMGNRFNSTDQFEKAVLDSCGLYSMPPVSLYEDILRYGCAGTVDILNTCSRLSGDINEAVISENEIKCKTVDQLPNIFRRKYLYQNPFCFHCFNNAAYVDEMCEDYYEGQRFDGMDFSLILSTRDEPKDAPVCGKEEMFDPLQKSCMQLNCPIFYLPVFGVCHEYARTASNLMLNFAFSAETNGEIMDSDYLGLHLVRFFKNHLNFNVLKNENSQRCNLVVFQLLKYYRTSNKTIIIRIAMMTTKLCTVYEVLRDTKYSAQLIASKRLNFQSINISISNITLLQTFNAFEAEVIYHKTVSIVRFRNIFVTPGLLEECPSVEIDVKQHTLKDEIEKYGKLQTGDGMVQICVEDYLALISSTEHLSMSKTILFFGFVFTMCSY